MFGCYRCGGVRVALMCDFSYQPCPSCNKQGENKMPKVWEAIGSGKCFNWGLRIYKGDGKATHVWCDKTKRWEPDLISWFSEQLFHDCTYVPDPSLVDFATAYEAAKAGKVVEREHGTGNHIAFRHGRLVELGCGGYPPLYITDDIIYGKFRILGGTE